MELNIIKDYTENNLGITQLCAKYKMGKLKIKDILTRHNIPIKKRGAQPHNKTYIVDDIKINKFPPLEEGWEYIAVCKKDGKIFKDYLNKAGTLINHLKKIEPTLEIPSDWKRLEYYKMTGIYWWEDYYDVIPRKIIQKEVKVCSICGWTTYDIHNKSGAFENHLKNTHQISKKEYVEKFPDEIEYFYCKNKTEQRQFETDETKYVTCAICGKKLSRIDEKHLAKHGITKMEYLSKYGGETISSSFKEYLVKLMTNNNINHITPTFTSDAETELLNFIQSYNIECSKNRSILKGQEIDIFIPSHNIGIEFNGNKWHTEWWGGKTRMYHLNKTLKCNSQNIGLIQIFEDEFHYKKDIIFNKIAHTLNIDLHLPKIMGRKCSIHEIDKTTAKEFLEQFHIQGFTPSTIYLGAYYNEKLIAVMSFKEDIKGTNKWELNRFASDYNFICQGIGGKLFTHFLKLFNPTEIKSFADRRWTINKERNFYTKLGFTLIEELKPDYRYYNAKIDRYERFHKFNFRKSILIKKYHFNKEMTETEMMKELGYDRIWDCGLFKYVWINPNKKEED